MKISKIIIFFTLIVAIVNLISSCDDKYTECTEDDYVDCYTDEPSEAEIVVHVTINKENPEVLLTIYEGKIDNNVIIGYDTAYEEEHYSHYLELGKYYSVTAKYKSGDKIIYALDGNKMYKKSRKVCDSTCWDIKGGIYELKLKYD